MPNPLRTALACAACCALSALRLAADDGVIEINQVRAEAGGVTPGDGVGFPVLITQPGSYRLTSNLDFSLIANAENRSGVEIRADGVVLDLNGFSIIGPTTCTGTPVTSCSPTGTGHGVDGNGQGNRDETTIRNGIVRGAGANGVRCNEGCIVEDLHAVENGGTGVHVSNGPATVRRVTARRNGSAGIWCAGVVSDSVAHGNLADGINLNGRGVGSGNVAVVNGGDGIRCNASVAVDNVASGNTGFGIELLNGCGYGRNVFRDNTAGASTGTGIQVDSNVCGSLLCP